MGLRETQPSGGSGKLEFGELPVIASQSADWRGNLPDRSTISQSFTGRFREIVQKNSLYDDGLPGIRWRFPHQCAHWFGMTMLFGARSRLQIPVFLCSAPNP